MEYLQIILKTIIFFFLLNLIIRLLGKREVGEISVFDLVVLLIIADVATLGIQYDWSKTLVIISSLVTILILQKLIAILLIKLPRLRGVFDYKPSIIIYDGKLNMKEFKKQAYTIDDLITQARGNGAMDLSEVRLAILESSGELSIYSKKEYEQETLPVIISGIIVQENLPFLKLEEQQVKDYLSKHQLKLKKVHFMSSDGKNFYVLEEL